MLDQEQNRKNYFINQMVQEEILIQGGFSILYISEYYSVNSGGIHKDKKYAEFSQSFVEHLRNYDASSPHSFVSQAPKGGIGLKVGNYSDSFMMKLYAMREYQRTRDFRLAQPKKKKTKYGNLADSEEFRLNRTTSLSPINREKNPLYKSFTFSRHMGRKNI